MYRNAPARPLVQKGAKGGQDGGGGVRGAERGGRRRDGLGFRLQKWYFRNLMAASSLFLGFYSSGGIDSTMDLILPRNKR